MREKAMCDRHCITGSPENKRFNNACESLKFPAKTKYGSKGYKIKKILGKSNEYWRLTNEQSILYKKS
jgi:hypothetical protein